MLTKESEQRRRLTDAVAAMLVVVTAFSYFAALAPYGLNVDDEGTLLYQIYRTYVGQTPYVDFHAGYTPGIFFTNAAIFSLVGVNVVALRLFLALTNSLSVLFLYLLSRRLLTRRLPAAAAGFAFAALIPFYDGQFAAFNIPYPIWYVTQFWLLTVLCCIAWLRRGGSLWWLLAGLCSGVVFSFKPNSGLLCLAGALIAVTQLQRPDRSAVASRGRLLRFLALLERVTGAMVPVVLALALAVFYGRGAGWREVFLFGLPLLTLVLFQKLHAPIHRSVQPMALLVDLVLLGLGFASVVLPWALYFWSKLGTRAFLRAILFVGTGFDKFYYLPHPAFGLSTLLLAAGFAGAALATVLIRRRSISPGWLIVLMMAGLAVAGGWFALYPPRMVEGVQASVVLRVRDLAPAIIFLLEWSALLAFVFVTQRVRRQVGSAEPMPQCQRFDALCVVLVAALLMDMQLYPRSDYMHLVPACPLLLVLGAWLFDRAGRWASQGLARSRRGRLAFGALTTVPIYLFLAILLTPAVRRIDYLIRAERSGDRTALVQLESPRAPLVVEPGSSKMFKSLNAVSAYLQSQTREGESVFTFPVLDMVCFTSERHNPTRHGYFFPGWPGHAVEAEVIDGLRTRPPRYIVTLHDHALYFANAPIYYFNLRQYVLAHYRVERRFGLLDVLRYAPQAPNERARKTEVATPRVPTSLPLWQAEAAHQRGATARRVEHALSDPRVQSIEGLSEVFAGLDTRAQRRLALLIRKSRSPAGIAAMARVLESRSLGPIVRELASRSVSESGDTESILPLLRWLKVGDLPDQLMASGLLYNVATKLSLENYWYGAPSRPELQEISKAISDEALIQWLDNPWEGFALRSFAIRISGFLGRTEIVPFLARVLGDVAEWPDLRVQAAQSLVQLGFGSAMMDPIIGLLKDDRVAPAALVAEVYPQSSAAGRAALVRQLHSPVDATRATAFWLAAGVRDAELEPEIVAGLADPLPDVRMAAAWGLGNLGDAGAAPWLRAALADPSDEVAHFAEQGLRRLPHEQE
ncbi:MAG: HEAT repeat domain-containing protein [Deltaproteobacteria bacterium]|nr:HEAT repeat domain-containing protein [Deltaproteobacteria bacterium]